MTTTQEYLALGQHMVRGMTSVTAMRVLDAVLAAQDGRFQGNLVELGAFEGRVSVLMGLHRRTGEQLVCVDRFDWPCPCTQDRLATNLTNFGVRDAVIVAADSAELAVGDPNLQQIRFAHIDAGHRPADLLHDLELIFAGLGPGGVVAVDDMVHPEFPELTAACLSFVADRDDVVLAAIIDRESFIGSAKFLLSRPADVEWVNAALAEAVPEWVFPHGAKVGEGLVQLITPHPCLQPM